MSSAGLHGYGYFDYLTSTTWSDDFLFHPDSMMTTSRRFLERENIPEVSYPYVENSATKVKYRPFRDMMEINRMESAFKMVNDSLFFRGDLVLRPAGLSGSGDLVFPDARFASKVFKFKAREVFADSSSAKMRKSGTDDYTFLTDNVNIDLNLVSRKGELKSNDSYSLVEMPANLYVTHLDHMTWFMDKDQVVMKQDRILQEHQVDIGIDSLRTSGPSYISRHPRQDSLNFVAPLATFSYNKNILDAEKVPFLAIGDSYVFPDERKVQVLQQATIKPLKNAKIMANTESRYHLMHHANLVIDSRRHFRGAADYDYVDEFGEVFTFRMNHVEVDTSLVTFGEGTIKAEENFKISPYFDYQGQVNMTADDPILTFAGGVRLTHDCKLSKFWLKFENRIVPDSILIPVDRKMQNLDLNNIYAGTLKARDSIYIYPTFLSGRKDYFDRNISRADGFLYFNKRNSSYEIAPLEKLQNMKAEGNYLALKTDSCQLVSEGDINMQLDFGQAFLKTVGTTVHDIDDNSLNLHMLMGMSFHFSPEALLEFGHDLDSLPDLKPVDLTSDFYSVSMKNLVGTTLAQKLDVELSLYGKYSVIPDSLKYALFFNDLVLNWNQETNSFRYNGKVGIGTIGDVQVNKYVDAYIEFVERGSGDIFDIYLMIDENTWYYLAYSPGALQVLSSNQVFNDMILDIPAKERKHKIKGVRTAYIYSLASTRRLSLFLDRFMMFEQEGE